MNRRDLIKAGVLAAVAAGGTLVLPEGISDGVLIVNQATLTAVDKSAWSIMFEVLDAMKDIYGWEVAHPAWAGASYPDYKGQQVVFRNDGIWILRPGSWPNEHVLTAGEMYEATKPMDFANMIDLITGKLGITPS